MAEVAGAYAAERVVEGTAAVTYGVAKSTMPLKGHFTRITSDTPLERSSHSMCAIANKIYVFGGEIQPRVPVDNEVHAITVPSGIHEKSDYVSIKSASAPPARVGHTAVAIGQWMYVFGGRGGKEMKALEENGRVWCFDTKINEWTALDPEAGSPLPEARSYHASTASAHPDFVNAGREEQASISTAVEKHGIVFIHGGCPASGRLADVWAFNVATRIWNKLPDAPGSPRGGAALVCSDDRLFRFGGFDGKDEIGGQFDFLEISKETMHSSSGGNWQSLEAEGPEAPFPGPRSVAGLHHITTGQGRNYLVLLLGERSPSGQGHDGAGRFWSDVWAFQLKPDGLTAASLKDATRRLVGMKTREYDWEEVVIPEVTMSEGRKTLPGSRGWFASSGAGDLDKAGIVLWGGIDESNQRLGDGYHLTLESA